MKFTTFVMALSALFVTGCYSWVQTYDASGNLVGECRSGGVTMGWANGATCTGSANPKDWGPITNHGQASAPATQSNCSDGFVYQYGQCYPISPAIGGGKVGPSMDKVKVGDKVQITTTSGAIIRGKVEVLSSEGGFILTQENGEKLSVAPSEIKSMSALR